MLLYCILRNVEGHGMSVAGPLPFPTITGVWEWRIGGEVEERRNININKTDSPLITLDLRPSQPFQFQFRNRNGHSTVQVLMLMLPVLHCMRNSRFASETETGRRPPGHRARRVALCPRRFQKRSGHLDLDPKAKSGFKFSTVLLQCTVLAGTFRELCWVLPRPL